MDPDQEPYATIEREMDRQILRPSDRQTGRETDRQRPMDKELEWQSLRKSDSEPDRQTLRNADRETSRQMDKPPERELDRHTLRQIDRELDRQTLWKAERELERHTLRQIDRDLDRQGSRKAERHSELELDRHTLRQIDRQAEAQQKQWLESRRVSERKWSEPRQHADAQWTDLRQVDRQSERQWMDRQMDRHRLPSPIPEKQICAGTEELLHDEESVFGDILADFDSMEQVGERSPSLDAPLGGTPVGRPIACSSKPNPPPQSSKPCLAKFRQRSLLESSGMGLINLDTSIKSLDTF